MAGHPLRPSRHDPGQEVNGFLLASIARQRPFKRNTQDALEARHGFRSMLRILEQAAAQLGPGVAAAGIQADRLAIKLLGAHELSSPAKEVRLSGHFERGRLGLDPAGPSPHPI
jgi:hypothetical protein